MKYSPFIYFIRNLLIVGFIICFFAIKCGSNYKKSSKETEEVDSTFVNDSTTVEETSNWNCSICGKTIQDRGYEEDMNGNWIPCEEPYQCQICSPSCGRKHVQNINSVARKYGVELDEQNNETSANTQGDYHMGNDGRIYENNKCGLCKGSGIERGRNIATGEEQGRICPMCEGRGVRTY
jgi:hypothetical protein